MAKKTPIDDALREGGFEEEPVDIKRAPVYRMIGDSKVPVSKHTGKLWKSRKDQSMRVRKRKNLDVAWEEAISYYKNDQLDGRNVGTDGNASRSTSSASRLTDTFSETENIVFANTKSLVPALYAKNPSIEVTLTNPTPSEQEIAWATMLKRFANIIAQRRTAPGINLKPIVRRSIVNAVLTNRAVAYVSYTHKAESSEQAYQDLAMLSEELKKAKDTKQIEEIEGKLQALESKVAFVSPSGPDVRWLHPKQVIVDPDSEQPDRSDAKWMGHYEFLCTEYLKATYATKDEDEYKSIYQPTHILKIGDAENNVEDEINNFSLLDDGQDYRKYGFEDEESYNAAKRTKVWFIWDRTTRRLMMYNDKDWKWPIWVWDDPNKLDSFFPYEFLEFYTDPEDNDAKGEVTYYLDQQDAINEINDEERKSRRWARFNIMFNKRLIDEKDVMKYLKGPDGTAVGVDLDPEVDLARAVFSAPPPSVQFKQLFDKEPKYRAIDRISSANEIGRGGEYRTNTTNLAIEQYNTVSGVQIDEKIDAVEDFIGRIMWKVIQLCIQFMEQETVAILIGPSAELWYNADAETIQRTISLRVEGGSTQKPTSQAKKKEAVEVGQVLGQFARITPIAAMVAIQVMERAFDEIVIKQEDWTAIRQSIQQQAQGQGGDEIAKIEQAVDQLPPQAKQALGKAIAQGVPVRQAMEQIMQVVQKTQQQQQPQGNEDATQQQQL
ncbi:hypothetical protein HC928_00595 [bacterium]|nr:hypothetical protein [bacterium]